MFPCSLQAVRSRKRLDGLSDFGRLDLAPLRSLHCRVSVRAEWLSSAVHSRPGSHSAHDRARQAALELSQPVPRRDRWTIGRSQAGWLGIATHDASASVGKGLDDVPSARGVPATSTGSPVESEDGECCPAVTIGGIPPEFMRVSRGFGERSPFDPTGGALHSPPL